MGYEHTAMAVRRFFSLRGKPVAILSDNARTFLQLKRDLEPHIRWDTIPERSPWFGGVYERLVQNVKRALRVSLRHHRLSFARLQVILYELSLIHI